MTTILSISGLFSLNSATSVYADSLTLTIPSSPLSLDLNPTINNGFASTSGSFNVKTDSAAGYTTSIKTKNESGDNSLINGNNKLSSISSVISEDTFKNGSEYINMWGWMPSRLNSEDNTNYQVAPGTEEVVLDKTEEASSDAGTDYNISLAAKVASDTPTGTYTNTFVVTALSNASPQKEYEPTECWGLSEGQTGSMTDPRDGETYTIARLKDGKCWMTENLRITGSSSFKSGHTKTLTSEDSDLQAGAEYELPDSNLSKFGVGSYGYDTTTGKNNDAAYVTTTSYSDSVHGAKNFDSGYYTWHTATAGTGTADQTTGGWNAPSSICPKGWKLPTGGSGGDFQTLTNAYSISNNTAGSNTLRGEPLNFTYAGSVGYVRGDLGYQGSYGRYWSSTVEDQDGAYDLYVGSSVSPTDYSRRPTGHSVRCVARGEKPENKGTMQTVNQWGDSVQEGETVLATDERDNTIYSVARLEDGELWMTQNLRIGSNEQETVLKPDTSDVASDFTLPVGTTKAGSSKTDTSGWYFNQYDTSHIYIESNTNYGGYYTWFAATAGEGTQSKSSGDTSHSICPKGWRLPTSTEITTLTEKYDTTTRNNNPPNFGSTVWAGLCDEDGCPRISGSHGYWWSSTAYRSASAYDLDSDSSDLSLYYSTKGNGHSVRCVQKEYKSMQKVDEWGSEVKTGESTEAKDERDGNTYTVTRLNDGKLWMTENLRITGSSSFQPGHSATLTSSDSDVSSDYPLPPNDISKFNVGSLSSSSSQWKENEAAYVATTSYTDSVHGAKNFESGYYTWHTATAGTGTADQTTKGWNAPSSICPKGWKLPTGGSGSDFQTLTNAYSISDNTDGSNTLRGEPLNFTYAGNVSYSDGVLSNQGGSGYYWSSTVYNQGNAYSLGIGSSVVRPTYSSGRSFGYSVRCVARKPKTISDLQYMQDWDTLSADEKTQVINSMEDGENYTLTDKRDNTQYTISKLLDGEIWMTQNLRIGSNEQETVLRSDTSDVASDFTLPAGTTKKGSTTDTTGWHYQQYNTSHIYINSDTNYGGYYTWFAATAGEGTESKSSGDTSHSICPKGWRLPTRTEITTLTGKYNTTTRNNNPPNFGSTVWAGQCEGGDGCSHNNGSYGKWWSSTAAGSSTSAWFLYSSSSSFDLYGSNKGFGLSVRCVARDPSE